MVGGDLVDAAEVQQPPERVLLAARAQRRVDLRPARLAAFLFSDYLIREIESARNNARRALEVVDEFGSLAAYFWRFEPPPATRPQRVTRDVLNAMPASAESIALSKDLKRRGWTFVGPTTVYAFMQAMGLVNDHVDDCATRAKAEAMRDAFPRPR